MLIFAQGGRTERVMFLHARRRLQAGCQSRPADRGDDLPGLIAAFHSREEKWTAWRARDPAAPWTENWWFAEAGAIEREDWDLSASRYRPESREAAEHRDPRELLEELQEDMTVILAEIEALAAELRGAGGVSQWPIAKLSDVAIFSCGGTPTKANPAFWNGDIPWVSPKDMKTSCITDAEDKITRVAVAQSAARIVGPGSVLAVVRSGILAHSFPVATLAMEVSFNQDIKAITPKNDDLLPLYLFWTLKSQEARVLSIGVKKGATVHSLSNGFLEALPFPLPPLEEQQRIANLLDRAAEIRRRADAARAKARAIIPALFLDMFGDPATNPKGWPLRALGELGELDRGRSRHRPRNAPELYGGPFPFVQTGDVANSNGRIRRYEQSYSEAGLAQSKMWPAGTLCITIAANIGKTGILEFDACFPDSVVGFKPKPEITSEFIQTSLDFMQSEIEARAPQAAQKNINLQVLRGLELMCPPIALQIAFADQAQRLKATAGALDTAATKAETMAAALSAEVFHQSPIRGRRCRLT